MILWGQVIFNSFNKSIYDVCKGKRCDYEKPILGNTIFRAQYNGIMQSLVDGPFDAVTLIDAIDTIETRIRPALELDPNNQGAPEKFEAIRNFINKRVPNVEGQLP